MSRAGKKLAAMVIWAGIGVLIGMQLGGTEGPLFQKDSASSQVQQVEQSQSGRLPVSPDPQIQDDPPAAPVKQQKPKFEPTPRDILLPEGSKPPADVLADKTAGLLQQLSNQSIRWVVSVFGSITE